MTASLTPPPSTPQSPTSQLPASTPRWVWALLIVLTATVVGGTAGLLAYAGGASVPNAILAGGGAFATAVGIQLAFAHFLGGRS